MFQTFILAFFSIAFPCNIFIDLGFSLFFNGYYLHRLSGVTLRVFLLYFTITFYSLLRNSSRDHFNILQAVLQISEDIVNSQLGLINDFIFRIFPNQTSLFTQTTPKEYLFDGVSFCLKGDEITALVCRVIEDIVKQRQIKAIRKSDDGSFKFAFFYYVSHSYRMLPTFV